MDRLEKYLRQLSEEFGKTKPLVEPVFARKMTKYVKGEIPGTIPAGLKKLYLEELPKMMYRKGYAESHPQEALDLAASVLGVGSTFAPSGEAVLGTIKGLKRGSPAAKAIRRAMADELRARKTPVGFLSREQEEFVKENPWFGDVLKGTWYHGRRSYPEKGMTFAGSRQKMTNLGEPRGISLSANPAVPQEFPGKPRTKAVEKINELLSSEKLGYARLSSEEKAVANKLGADFEEGKISFDQYAQKLDKLFASANSLEEALITTQEKISLDRIKTPVGRVFPLYKRPPEEVILPAWKKENTKWAGEILKDAYKKALEKTTRILDEDFAEKMRQAKLAAEGFPPDLQESVVKETLKDWLQFDREANVTFNTIFTEELRGKGYKGLLYSPRRYDEYELRLFDPGDVMMLDTRRLSSVKGGLPDEIWGGSIVKRVKPKNFGTKRTFRNPKKEPWERVISREERDNASLRAWWQEIDLVGEAERLLRDLKGESW